MRLVTYDAGSGRRPGVLVGDSVVDTAGAAIEAGLTGPDGERWSSNRRILEAGDEALAALSDAAVRLARGVTGTPVVRRREAVQLGPPIEDPEKFICLGLNYRDHAQEAGLAVPEVPMLFAKFRNSLIGPADPIVIPPAAEHIDYEAELAVVIGRRCKDAGEAEALDYVAGAMALNDVTARDLQHQTSQWLAGKAIDTFAPCGPALVLRDELGDLGHLTITARVNGRVVQNASTALMIFSVAETVSFISSLMTLVPGDVIATGTPAGVGFQRRPQVLLTDGDLVEVEIEGIGSLCNPVSATKSAGRESVPRTSATTT
jgi:acylpyruvate hydrolase